MIKCFIGVAFIVSVYGDVSHLSYDLQQHPLLSNLVEFEIEPQYLEYIPPSLISAASLGNDVPTYQPSNLSPSQPELSQSTSFDGPQYLRPAASPSEVHPQSVSQLARTSPPPLFHYSPAELTSGDSASIIASTKPPFRGDRYLPPSAPLSSQSHQERQLQPAQQSEPTGDSPSVVTPFHGNAYLPPTATSPALSLPSQPEPQPQPQPAQLPEPTQDSPSVVTPFRANAYLPPPVPSLLSQPEPQPQPAQQPEPTQDSPNVVAPFHANAYLPPPVASLSSQPEPQPQQPPAQQPEPTQDSPNVVAPFHANVYLPPPVASLSIQPEPQSQQPPAQQPEPTQDSPNVAAPFSANAYLPPTLPQQNIQASHTQANTDVLSRSSESLVQQAPLAQPEALPQPQALSQAPAIPQPLVVPQPLLLPQEEDVSQQVPLLVDALASQPIQQQSVPQPEAQQRPNPVFPQAQQILPHQGLTRAELQLIMQQILPLIEQSATIQEIQPSLDSSSITLSSVSASSQISSDQPNNILSEVNPAVEGPVAAPFSLVTDSNPQKTSIVPQLSQERGSPASTQEQQHESSVDVTIEPALEYKTLSEVQQSLPSQPLEASQNINVQLSEEKVEAQAQSVGGESSVNEVPSVAAKNDYLALLGPQAPRKFQEKPSSESAPKADSDQPQPFSISLPIPGTAPEPFRAPTQNNNKQSLSNSDNSGYSY